MEKIILWAARGIIIKKLNEKHFGNQFIDTVLKALELRECGVPKMDNPPPPPQRPVKPGSLPYIKAITANRKPN